jgi:hypothetical protein
MGTPVESLNARLANGITVAVAAACAVGAYLHSQRHYA